MFFVRNIGSGFPPGYVPHGSSSLGLFTWITLPYGESCAIALIEYKAPRSVKIPAEARTDIFPSPFGSQARPSRGVKMLYRLAAMLFWPHVHWGSPGKTRPAGALA